MLIAFLATSLLVIVTPGPDTVLTLRSTLAGGRGAGIASAAGVAIGQLAWATATSAGLAAILVASETVFVVVKLCGAAYLVALGVQSLLAARRARTDLPAPERGDRSAPVARAFRQGLVSNLTNPKMPAFFTGLLPQFAPHGPGSFEGLLALGVAFAALTLAWLTLYACGADRVRAVLRRDRVRRLIDAGSGIALVGLGLRVAAERR